MTHYSSTNLPSGFRSRRHFVARSLGIAATSLFFPFPAPRATAAGLQDVAPDVEFDLAALGARLQEVEPGSAKRLESFARKAVGLADGQSIDFATAKQAQALLCEPARISSELAVGDIVIADGWLLTFSEAGVALLFAAAHAQLNH